MLLSWATGSVSSGNMSASLAVKRTKLQATILRPLETRKVARGDTAILSPKPLPYSTDSHRMLTFLSNEITKTAYLE